MSTSLKFLIFLSVLCVVVGYSDFSDDVPWNKARQATRIRDRCKKIFKNILNKIKFGHKIIFKFFFPKLCPDLYRGGIHYAQELDKVLRFKEFA